MLIEVSFFLAFFHTHIKHRTTVQNSHCCICLVGAVLAGGLILKKEIVKKYLFEEHNALFLTC